MTSYDIPDFNPKLDLLLERVVDVPVERVWQVWTQPELLKPWFCPKPWYVSDCEIDLRPGGKFRTLMRGPNGESHDNTGCFLEIVENRRLVWTSRLGASFRPVDDAFLPMTAFILLEPAGKGTRYRAVVLHRNEAECQKHVEMGFEGGWGTALEQMVAMIKAG